MSTPRLFQDYESKWQKMWEEQAIYHASQPGTLEAGEKFYGLVEFPFPSGAGLHVGHPRSYVAIDVITRKKRMEGKNVLFPMGWDAFGLPTENYAIKNHVKPQDATIANVNNFRRQLKAIGFGFDWEREVNTTDPAYYKWTQWMFLQFFKSSFDESTGKAKFVEDREAPVQLTAHGPRPTAIAVSRQPSAVSQPRMAYKTTTTINWCPSCKIGLANEEAIGGVCERCGSVVEKREKAQWMIGITKYAERLINDLSTVNYLERIKKQQIDWIGRSEGAYVKFQITNSKLQNPDTLAVFTTRPDTLFGVTYVVLAPEHEFVSKWIADGVVKNVEDVRSYQIESAKKADMDRTAEGKEKTGVKLEGVTAINPANGEEVPVFIADYVLAGYGTGAVMAVPAHDERDFAFAKKYELPIRTVVYRPKKRTCFVIHGIGGYSQENWFPWLKNKLEENGWNVIIPDLPDTDHPTVESWRKTLLKYSDQLDEESVVIGHSLGGIAAIDLVQEIGKKIGMLILVAPTSPRDWSDFNKVLPEVDASAIQCFNDSVHIDWSKLRSLVHQSVVFYSDNDPYIKKEDIDFYRNEFHGIKDIIVPGKFHFSSTQGIYEFPELLEELIDCYIENGISINSDFLNGLSTEEAKKKISSWLAEHGKGGPTTNYKLRDWIFSRQRYWGEPIPVVICPECGYVPVPEDQLPVLLPDVDSYEPTENGESPLAKIREWVETTCPHCGGKAERETDTMPNWAGSSWYFMRYCDPHNDTAFASEEALKYWMPVDLYNGGMEHTTLHLLYSRFWHKMMWDLGLLPESIGPEPYASRVSHGLILAQGGEKMSKSKGNVVNPDDVINEYGADVFRAYMLFIGPFDQPAPWDTNGIEGVKRFLDKIWRLFEERGARSEEREESVSLDSQTRRLADLETLYHQSIKKISEDIENLGFNTAISQLMILTNAFTDAGGVPKEMVEGYLKLLAPFIPHTTEELWNRVERDKSVEDGGSIHLSAWPKYDEAKTVSATFELVIQINGKVRDRIQVASDISEEEARAKALASVQVQKYLEGKEPKKIIYVKGKLVTIAI